MILWISRNDSSVDLVIPFSENGQILAEPEPVTGETFSSQISNVVFVNDIGILSEQLLMI